MGHRDGSDKHKDKNSRSKEQNKPKRKRSRERSIEIISEEKGNDFSKEDLIIDDDDELLTKRLNASIAKAKERKMIMKTESSVKPTSAEKVSKDKSVIMLFDTDEIPLPSTKVQKLHGSLNNASQLSNIHLPCENSVFRDLPYIGDGDLNDSKTSSHSPPPCPPMSDLYPPISHAPLSAPPASNPSTEEFQNLSQSHQPFNPPTQEPLKNEHVEVSKFENSQNFSFEHKPFNFGHSHNVTEQPFVQAMLKNDSSVYLHHFSDISNKIMEDRKASKPSANGNLIYPLVKSESNFSFFPPPPPPALEAFQEASEDPSKATTKKPMMKMSLKISETSAALISSGVMHKKEQEEGQEMQDAKTQSAQKRTKPKKSRWGLDAEEENDGKKKNREGEDKSKSSWRNRSRSSSMDKKEAKEEKAQSPKSSSKGSSKRSRSKKTSKRSSSRSKKSRSKERSKRSRSRSRDRSRKSRSRSRNRSKRSRSKSRDRSRRSRSRERSRRSRSRSRERLRRMRGRMSRWGKTIEKRVSSEEDDKEVNNGLNIDKARLRQIALKNAFKMGLASQPSLAAAAAPTCKLADEGNDKNNQTIKELTEFCKKISDVKDEDLDKIVGGNVVVVDEEEMPFIPARTNKDIKAQNGPERVLTLQEKLMEVATISSLFPVSRGDDHQSNKNNSEQSKEMTGIAGVPDDDEEGYKPLDKEALKLNNWVAPGQFIGASATAVKATPLQLEGGPGPDKDMFTKAPKVTGGIGRMMLMKLGWKEGEGLGKNKHGMTDLIPVNIKTDRKGFVCSEEDPDQLRMKALEQAMMQQNMMRQMAFMRQAQMMQQRAMLMQKGSSKPPLLSSTTTPLLRMPSSSALSTAAASLRQPLLPIPGGQSQVKNGLDAGGNSDLQLIEVCATRGWPTPQFILLEEIDPISKAKMFKFKITLNGLQYVSPQRSAHKKQAKNDAALLCLQKLGLAP